MSIHVPREYVHEQSIPADEWNIVHGFGRAVVVDVFLQLDGWETPRKVMPEDVKLVNANTIKITFAGRVVSGTAVLR